MLTKALLWTAALATTTGGVVAVGVVYRRHTVASRPAISQQPPVQELTQRLERLESQLKRTSARLAIVQRKQGEPSQSTAASEVPIRHRPQAASASTRFESRPRTGAEIAASLDGVLETESTDPAWAPTYERDIRSAIAEAFPGHAVLEAVCRTTICRVHVEHPSGDGASSFQSSVPHVFKTASSGHVRNVTEGDNHRTEIYLIRGGYSAPPNTL